MKQLLLIIFLFYIPALFASSHLKSNYTVDTQRIMLHHIFPDTDKKDTLLFQIDPHKHILRVSEKKVIAKLHTLGFNNIKHTHSYIQFTQKSPIDTTRIKNEIKSLYSKLYSNIVIQNIEVLPRSFLTQLPHQYTIHFQKRAPLAAKGILYIKTPHHKEIFFNYTLQAKVTIITARKTIKKGEELSEINTKKKSIILNKFRAYPIQHVNKGVFQAKHTIKKSHFITQRDVTALLYIHRGDDVSVTLNNHGLSINFSAIAVENGTLGEQIYVRHKNGKKIKVIITGRNKAEVQ